ncbi:MAG: FAD-dependent oxidoreductase [Planctomycetaceae bacterium]|nr:FAD-dependent oxidoreductase [Planctomycetaceae bacterium]
MQLCTDVVIFGGGVAGLWALDQLTEAGYSAVLLESRGLGAGQSIAAQGIIHGGLKYSLQGMLTASAAEIREMPHLWKSCLEGRQLPDLSAVKVRSPFCYLWRTDSMRSRLGMVGARIGLRVAPQSVSPAELPDVLRQCPGSVARLAEPVIDPGSLLETFRQRHQSRLLQISPDVAPEFELNGTGDVRSIRITSPDERQTLRLLPQMTVLTAGAGNAGLRSLLRLPGQKMQTRPLHMVLVRGDLPELNGHCVDGARTRATITADVDQAGRRVWQVGGQLAEEGVQQTPEQLLSHAMQELQEVLPGFDLSGTEWATYRVDRAEQATRGGLRPESPGVLTEGNVLSCWPAKLALAPQLATMIVQAVGQHAAFRTTAPLARGLAQTPATPEGWPVPDVAAPPWERNQDWVPFSSRPGERRAAA